MGLPFVTSADLVSAYPAASVAVADYVDDLIPLLAMTQNAQTGVSYSFLLADFTKLVTLNNASAVAVTLPLEATVAWPTSTQLRLLNIGAGTVTVAGAAGVTINGTPLTLAQYKGANIIKTGTNTWVFIPFASGIGAAAYSDANTGTYAGYAYITFTTSGTLTVTTAGFADILVIGSGGGGGKRGATGGGGGGAGGYLAITNAYLPAGTLTVTVAAGGAGSTTNDVAGQNGLPSGVGQFISAGGGGGGAFYGFGADCVGGNGASGGGAGSQPGGAAGSGFTGLGSTGGAGVGSAAGGGGGGGAVGAAGVSTTGGAGGAGVASTLTNTSITRGGGGGGMGSSAAGAGGAGGGGAGASTGVNGTANTGGGGGGGYSAGAGGNGGSGLVLVRVAV